MEAKKDAMSGMGIKAKESLASLSQLSSITINLDSDDEDDDEEEGGRWY